MTSIKDRAVRPWDICLPNQVPQTLSQPTALSGINRYAVRARGVVEKPKPKGSKTDCDLSWGNGGKKGGREQAQWEKRRSVEPKERSVRREAQQNEAKTGVESRKAKSTLFR